MSRYIAFLRAINVGGRTVKMAALREVFEAAGYRNVSTFIASGNVLLEADSADASGIEIQIEKRLRSALGFEVATFLRSNPEVEAIAAYRPFPDIADSFYVAFLRHAPSSEATSRVLALNSEVDQLHIAGREIYWRIQGGFAGSAIGAGALEKAAEGPVTVRNINTIRRLSARFPG